MDVKNWFAPPRKKTRPSKNSLDIYNSEAMSELIPECAAWLWQDTLPVQSKKTVEAAQCILAPLFRDARLRKRFPKALSEGGEGRYARWLLEHSPWSKRMAAKTKKNILSVFAELPGKRIFNTYVRDSSLQVYRPAALLTGCQKWFVNWLLDTGRRQYKFKVEEIIFFLQLCAENRPQMIAVSYSLQPTWQESFPHALDGADDGFTDWLDDQFRSLAPALSASQFPPEISQPEAQVSLASGYQMEAPFSWKEARLPNRITLVPQPQQGVNVLGPYCYLAGIGHAAHQTIAGLHSIHEKTSCRDIPSGQNSKPRCDYLGREIFDISIIHSVPDASLENLYRHIGLPLRANCHRIGVWYWELEHLPVEWLANIEMINEVWAPTRFIAETIRKTIPLPVYEMLPAAPMGRTGNYSRVDFGIPETPFLFLFMFDMASIFQRKNPLAVLRAFKLAFANHENVSLVIKISRGEYDLENLDLLKSEATHLGVLILNEVMPLEKANALMALCDCYVSLHRSEGFGLTMAEAMQRGKPVIGTGYSGNLDFMNNQNSLLVDSERVPVDKSVRIYGGTESYWAEPSIEDAAQKMRWVFENQAEARILGTKAKKEISQLLSVESAGKRMQQRLQEIREKLPPPPQSRTDSGLKIGIYSESPASGPGGAEQCVAVVAEALSEKHRVQIVHHKSPQEVRSLGTYAGCDLSRVNYKFTIPEVDDSPVSGHPWMRYFLALQWRRKLSEGQNLFIGFLHNRPPFCKAGHGVLIVLFPTYKTAIHFPKKDSKKGATNKFPTLPDNATGWFRWEKFHRFYLSFEWKKRLATYPVKLAISEFSRGWTKKRWGCDCEVLHPPVNVDFARIAKTKAILSVGRFAGSGHSKRQLEMLQTFHAMRDQLTSYRFDCVGGLSDQAKDQAVYEQARHYILDEVISVVANVPRPRLKNYFEEAAIFWHAAGYGDDEKKHPEDAEHFGITTVEAMAAGCVPIVINKGGQREIVEHGVTGFLWDTLEELKHYTLLVARDEKLRLKISDSARLRAQDFSKSAFVSCLLKKLPTQFQAG